MSRSIWKSLFFKRLKKSCLGTTPGSLHIWSRASVISQSLIGFTVFVHNGKIFKRLKITRDKVGFKFGFFVSTRNKFTLKNLKKR